MGACLAIACIAVSSVLLAFTSIPAPDPSSLRISDLAGQTAFGTCVGTWTAIAATVSAGTSWSLATGEPEPDAFALSPGCAFEPSAPASTPLAMPPEDSLPWVALVDGVPNLVADFNPGTGEMKLLNDADAGSTVRVQFYFAVGDGSIPDPFPVPAAGAIALILLGGLFALALWRGLRTGLSV